MCNRGGAYIICDLNSTLAHAPIAAFRIILYFTCKHLDIPDLEQHIDISISRLRELKDTTVADPDYPEIAEEPVYNDDDAIEEPDSSDEEET